MAAVGVGRVVVPLITLMYVKEAVRIAQAETILMTVGGVEWMVV